jgi:hypothetical protein
MYRWCIYTYKRLLEPVFILSEFDLPKPAIVIESARFPTNFALAFLIDGQVEGGVRFGNDKGEAGTQ